MKMLVATKRIFYGWWVVLAASVTLFVCAGIGFFTFPVFFKFIQTEMQWSRTSLSVAGMLAALAAGFFTPIIGWAIDRFDARTVMIPGSIILAASFLLLGQITRVFHLWALFLAVGVGMAATTILPSQTLVSRWFERKRGRAMGVVTVAGALGGMVWMPVTSRLISVMGWRDAYDVLGIIIAVFSLPLVIFIVRSSPRSMGLQVDGLADPVTEEGEQTALSANVPGEDTGYTAREAFRTGSFWLILSATFFVVFASSGFGLHIIPFLSDSGLPDTRAPDVWSAALGVSIGARFLFGFLSEKYQKRYFASAANVSRTVCLLALVMFAQDLIPAAAALSMLVIIYGLGMGCNAVINPLVISESFGVKSFGKIMGFLGIPYTIGMGLGQFMGGYLFDLQKDYSLAFTVFGGSFLLAGISIILARPCFLYDRMSEQR